MIPVETIDYGRLPDLVASLLLAGLVLGLIWLVRKLTFYGV